MYLSYINSSYGCNFELSCHFLCFLYTYYLFPYTTLFRSNCYGLPWLVMLVHAIPLHAYHPAHAQALSAKGPADNNAPLDRKSTRLNSSHVATSYAALCFKKKKS